MQERNYHIYLNHTSLLRAILLHSGIPEDKLAQASNILCDAMVSACHTCITNVFLIAHLLLMAVRNVNNGQSLQDLCNRTVIVPLIERAGVLRMA